MKITKIMAAIVLTLVLGLAGCENGSSPSTSTGTMICFGDSLTEGYGASSPGVVDKTKSYPAVLQGKVTLRVVNAGKTGDTAAGGLARVDKDVISKNPQVVVILLGANDFMGLRSANETKADLQGIMQKINTNNRKIFLASFIGDSGWEAAFIEALNLNPVLASSAKLLLNTYKTMFNELASENKDVVYIPDIWAGEVWKHMSDQIHPNADGYSIMANNIFNAMEPYLRENNYKRRIAPDEFEISTLVQGLFPGWKVPAKSPSLEIKSFVTMPSS
ncbi:MAG: GDSL-type esterase/lipase family protein [Treponema sp.]|nr:GDSL-type esterase/lipase family protein [Treponema sp.]